VGPNSKAKVHIMTFSFESYDIIRPTVSWCGIVTSESCFFFPLSRRTVRVLEKKIRLLSISAECHATKTN